MVKVLEVGDQKVNESYYKLRCNHCHSILAAKHSEVWIEDYDYGVGRIECPVCRRKVFLKTNFIPLVETEELSQEEFDNAHSDVSKSGLQMLIDAKKKEG